MQPISLFRQLLIKTQDASKEPIAHSAIGCRVQPHALKLLFSSGCLDQEIGPPLDLGSWERDLHLFWSKLASKRRILLRLMSPHSCFRPFSTTQQAISFLCLSFNPQTTITSCCLIPATACHKIAIISALDVPSNQHSCYITPAWSR
jgi:hypothetical protein